MSEHKPLRAGPVLGSGTRAKFSGAAPEENPPANGEEIIGSKPGKSLKAARSDLDIMRDLMNTYDEMRKMWIARQGTPDGFDQFYSDMVDGKKPTPPWEKSMKASVDEDEKIFQDSFRAGARFSTRRPEPDALPFRAGPVLGFGSLQCGWSRMNPSIDWNGYEERARGMSSSELHYALLDIQKTQPNARALDREDGGDREGWYSDEASIYRKEQERRRKGGSQGDKMQAAETTIDQWGQEQSTQSPHRSVEIKEGLSGSGFPVWFVQIVKADGRPEQQGPFDTKAEAEYWMKNITGSTMQAAVDKAPEHEGQAASLPREFCKTCGRLKIHHVGGNAGHEFVPGGTDKHGMQAGCGPKNMAEDMKARFGALKAGYKRSSITVPGTKHVEQPDGSFVVTDSPTTLPGFVRADWREQKAKQEAEKGKTIEVEGMGTCTVVSSYGYGGKYIVTDSSGGTHEVKEKGGKYVDALHGSALTAAAYDGKPARTGGRPVREGIEPVLPEHQLGSRSPGAGQEPQAARPADPPAPGPDPGGEPGRAGARSHEHAARSGALRRPRREVDGKEVEDAGRRPGRGRPQRPRGVRQGGRPHRRAARAHQAEEHGRGHEGALRLAEGAVRRR
jgi:hypothetical protein